MAKFIVVKIEHCNHSCPYFYHNFYDNEHIWCAKLDKRIKECENGVNVFSDYRRRPIPEFCPLEDFKD